MRSLTGLAIKNCETNTAHSSSVDARHDYKGVLADLEAWWPLVSDGGIMAGELLLLSLAA
jgi:hypothetical protein